MIVNGANYIFFQNLVLKSACSLLIFNEVNR